MSNAGPVILLLVSALAWVSAGLPTSWVAGKLLQLSDASTAILTTISRKRVSPLMPYMLGGLGVSIGAAVGAILAGLIGWQGWLAGILLAMAGLILPRTLFTAGGWDRRFVQRVNEQAIVPLRVVYILTGAGQPIDEALRSFAHGWAAQSIIADLLLGCPATQSSVDFLKSLEIPGAAYLRLVMALDQASSVPASARRRVLAQHLQMAFLDLKFYLNNLAERRAQMALIIGVLILLPTLMITVLAPPLVSAVKVLSNVNLIW